MKHKITEITPGSIAEELEITPGDILLQINEKKIKDVLDYRFFTQEEELLIEIQKPDGEIWELEIEKDAEEDLGLIFERPLMSAARQCANDCIFCFVAQQPKGLRKSLYVKDDDIRLSFLHGNYVTLTNLSPQEITRIAGYHLSPLRISIHSADTAIRKKMMNNPAADNLHAALTTFSNANIKMHFQIVLCKGINDFVVLDEAITCLKSLKGAESLAVVPAGITRHRDGLPLLTPFTQEDAKNVIAQVDKHKGFVFASDEWYIMAGQDLPSYDHYEDFPQLDNGVGMLRLFEKEFLEDIGGVAPTHTPVSVGVITGDAAAGFMRDLLREFTNITIHPIKNNFFGENITVSGLLTGEDIIAQLQGRVTDDILFLPGNAFRRDTEVMLDGTTLSQLSAALSVPIKIGSSHGGEFATQLKEVLT